MLDYIQKFKKPEKQKGFRCGLQIFRPLAGGVTLSSDFSVNAGTFEDFNLDKAIAAGQNIPDGPAFPDNSVDSFEAVDKAAVNILDSNEFVIHDDSDDDNSNKN